MLLEQAISEWRAFLLSARGASGAFPSETPIGRCMREGPGASQPTGKTPCTDRYPRAEEIDKIICEFPRNYQRVLIMKHLQQRKIWEKGKLIRVVLSKGKVLKVPRSTYYHWIERAESMLAERVEEL